MNGQATASVREEENILHPLSIAFGFLLLVRHACSSKDGTTEVKITLPQYSDWALQSVRAAKMDGWNYTYTTRDITSLGYTSYGNAVTSTVDELIWKTDVPVTVSRCTNGMGGPMGGRIASPDNAARCDLQDEYFVDFGIKFKLAMVDGSFPFAVGDVMYMPTMQ